MARWMRFHLNGGELDGVRLMSAATHARMWTRGYPDRPAAPDIAHGFQDRHYAGLRVIGHTGASSAFASSMVLVPELGVGIFVSQSSRQSWQSVNQLPGLIIDHLVGREYQPTLAAQSGDAGALAELAGTYLQNTRVHTSLGAIIAKDWTAQVMPTSDETLMVRIYGEGQQFRRVAGAPDVFEAATGERIGFLREGGSVVALVDTSGFFSFEKLGPMESAETLNAVLGAALLLSATTLLGFWWRAGRGPAYGQGIASRVAAGASLWASLSVFVFIGAAARLQGELATLGFLGFAEHYPRPGMFNVHYAAWALVVATTGHTVALVPAWRASGWTVWRRLHYSAFAIVLLLAAWQLWEWRLYGAPVH